MGLKNSRVASVLLLSFTGLLFYVFPLFALGDTGWGIYLLLIITPISCLICGAIHTIIYGFKWYFPILLGLLYLPTIAIYYNTSALIYLLIFPGIAYIGSILALLVKKILRTFRS